MARRRSSTDPRYPPTWLVVRSDAQALHWLEITSGVELLDFLGGVRSRYITDGFECGAIENGCVFFAERQGVRLRVALEHYHPKDPDAPAQLDDGSYEQK
jgi:hypothetical protein